ncbi:MAG TPA: methyltransferase domain-containing protein [Arenimonas sp.]|nr:methyltransferase domain-containing protein [Arenimonas sp.]
MQHERYDIQFPLEDSHDLRQDQAFFYLQRGDERARVRFHDYSLIYSLPGLYEQLFYDRLKCQSPRKMAEILKLAVGQSSDTFHELRVLDLGAGNGMMGEELKKYGVARLVGLDILDAAEQACHRDRPGTYDAYYVADLCQLAEKQRRELASWHFDALTTVAALGFGDIPQDAFIAAFNLIQEGGWIAFNIKEDFLKDRDPTGFSHLVRTLILSEYLDVYHLERYRHRLSIDGTPLFYYAIAGRKRRDIGRDWNA